MTTPKTCRLEITPEALAQIDDLRPWQGQALRKLGELEANPLKGERLKGTLEHSRSLHFSLKGGGQYRAAYLFEGDVCIVYFVGPRENFYKRVERRARDLPR
ncbi:MAG: type II toxin-antitoxin system RelE/ParE family toxin [Chloroflexota bacterium]|nr:type II toxin-antitoxin system RelE/ParE family toxin [Chloroflexota bacterium]